MSREYDEDYEGTCLWAIASHDYMLGCRAMLDAINLRADPVGTASLIRDALDADGMCEQAMDILWPLTVANMVSQWGGIPSIPGEF